MSDDQMSKLNQMSKFVKEQEEWINSTEGQETIRRNRDARRADHNSMAYWFPKILSAGLPVPKTILVDTDGCELTRFCDGETHEGFATFHKKLQDAGNELGWPCFIRTEQGSGKHQWENTCFLPNADAILQHVYNLVEWSECADFTGLSYFVWAVRELLPTMPLGRLTNYGNMPLCREFRFFTAGGKVVCYHPYWPQDAIEEGKPDWEWEPVSGMRMLEITPCEIEELTLLAERVAASCPDDDWSIDFLWTARGFYLTDMAVASRSWHWKGCLSG